MNQSIAEGFSELGKYAHKYRADRFRQLGLRGNSHRFLLALDEHPGISQDQLSQLILRDKGNTARQLAWLEEEGFLRREVCPSDRRVFELYLTEKGKQALRQVRAILAEWDEELTAGFDEARLAAFEATLQQLVQRARQLAGEEEA
jgi:DNA-binding MarR family transcriptional regulator